MIIFLIVLALVLVSVIVAVSLRNNWNHEGLFFGAMATAAILGVVVIIMGIAIYLENLSPCYRQAELNKLNAEREALEYQISQHFYLGNSLSDYNSKVINGKMYHENPWINWFQGDYIMEVEPIAIE